MLSVFVKILTLVCKYYQMLKEQNATKLFLQVAWNEASQISNTIIIFH